MAALVMLAMFFAMLGALVLFARGVAVRLGGWAKSYQLLAKRYGTKVKFLRSRPRIKFNYGKSRCTLKNTSTPFGKDRKTQLSVLWPDRRFKLLITSNVESKRLLSLRKLYEVEFEPVELDESTGGAFRVFSNQPEVARQIINPSTQWQIQQLIRHAGNTGVEIFLNRGLMNVCKPGYIKQSVALDDFVRFGLELYDQFKVALNQDIEFLADEAPTVLSDVTCPICSEKIHHQMVTCIRCRTPHCADCWEYNGQCATFACNETRFMQASSSPSHSSPQPS